MYRCQKCQNDFTKAFESCPMCGGQLNLAETRADVELFSDLDLPFTLDPSKHQYKVITQKDRFFSNKFNPALIERALNEYAQDGWVFKNAVSADFGSLGVSRNELIIFMEKAPNGEVNS
jgi:hypothetical protein